MQVTIAELLPYDLSAVTGKVAMQKKLLEKNEAKPIKVLKLEKQWLVTDGANRVVAAKEMGRTTVEAIEVFRQVHEMQPYRDALVKAVANGWRGFENFPQSEAPAATRPKIPVPVNYDSLYKRPVQAPAAKRPATVVQAGLGLTDVMNIVKGCMTRERLRVCGVIGAKGWIVTKADGSPDLAASAAKLSDEIADITHDDQVFAWKEPGK